MAKWDVKPSVRVKPLEWCQLWSHSDSPREYARTPTGSYYHVSDKGWWHPADYLHQCGSIDAAKAAAQAHYEACIMSALIIGGE